MSLVVKTGFRSARQEDVHRAKRSALAKKMIYRGGAETRRKVRCNVTLVSKKPTTEKQ